MTCISLIIAAIIDSFSCYHCICFIAVSAFRGACLHFQDFMTRTRLIKTKAQTPKALSEAQAPRYRSGAQRQAPGDRKILWWLAGISFWLAGVASWLTVKADFWCSNALAEQWGTKGPVWDLSITSRRDPLFPSALEKHWWSHSPFEFYPF